MRDPLPRGFPLGDGERRREQADLAAAQDRAGEGQFLAPGSRVSAFDPGELLQEADGDVGCFGQGELFCGGTYGMHQFFLSLLARGFQSLKKREKRRKGCGVNRVGLKGTPTTDANPRPTVERQILPSNPQSLLPALVEPAFGLEELRVFPVEVSAPVHAVQTPVDELALFDEDGRFAVFAAANR